VDEGFVEAKARKTFRKRRLRYVHVARAVPNFEIKRTSHEVHGASSTANPAVILGRAVAACDQQRSRETIPNTFESIHRRQVKHEDAR